MSCCCARQCPPLWSRLENCKYGKLWCEPFQKIQNRLTIGADWIKKRVHNININTHIYEDSLVCVLYVLYIYIHACML